MIAWALNHPYVAGAAIYVLLICGVMLFMVGAADEKP